MEPTIKANTRLHSLQSFVSKMLDADTLLTKEDTLSTKEDNVPQIQELCRYNLSEECLKIGPKSEFLGRCCCKCTPIKQHQYYLLNKDKMIAYCKNRRILLRKKLIENMADAPA